MKSLCLALSFWWIWITTTVLQRMMVYYIRWLFNSKQNGIKNERNPQMGFISYSHPYELRKSEKDTHTQEKWDGKKMNSWIRNSYIFCCQEKKETSSKKRDCIITTTDAYVCMIRVLNCGGWINLKTNWEMEFKPKIRRKRERKIFSRRRKNDED